MPKMGPIRLGTAFFDKGRCLPWAMETPCVVCEEVCPVSPKAIGAYTEEITRWDGKKVTLNKPYMRPELCIGCGICEHECPVVDQPAVYVTAVGESRSKDRSLLLNSHRPIRLDNLKKASGKTNPPKPSAKSKPSSAKGKPAPTPRENRTSGRTQAHPRNKIGFCARIPNQEQRVQESEAFDKPGGWPWPQQKGEKMSHSKQDPTRRDILIGGAAVAAGTILGAPLAVDDAEAAKDKKKGKKGQTQKKKDVPQVPRKVLGKTKESIPILLFGAGFRLNPVFDPKLAEALRYGVNYIDAADCYAGSTCEAAVASFHKRIKGRDKLWITSKSDIWDPKGFEKRLDRSLKRLQTNYVNLYYLHGLDDKAALNKELEKNRRQTQRNKANSNTLGSRATAITSSN